MQYLSLFDRKHADLAGHAQHRSEPWMPFGQAVFLHSPNDAVSITGKGRQIGIIFLRHDRSGIVEVEVGDQSHCIDLFSSQRLNWVFEILPQNTIDYVSITVRVSNKRNPDSYGTEVWIQAVYVSEYLTNEIPELIQARVDDQPLKKVRLNQLTDVFKWYDPDWLMAKKSVAPEPAYFPPDFVHRKSWEWVQCVYGLSTLGMIRSEHRALGIGVGWEPLSFFFSNYLQEVVATDLYPVKGQWSETGDKEGAPEILDDPDQFAPGPYRRECLRFLRMDGTKLDFPDASFDIVWSCSSIEHFAGHSGALQSMLEVERVLKPGGCAAIITEYVLPDPTTGLSNVFDSEYFNLRCLYEYLIRPLTHLRLVQGLDLSIPDYYVKRACRLPDEASAPHSGSSKPHIVLQSPSGALFTSIALFYRKLDGPHLTRKS